MKTTRLNSLALAALAACALLLPSSLMSGPIVVRINDVLNAPPVVTVVGAPNGYDLYTGEFVATPGVEEGALITFFGVDRDGQMAEHGWRTTDPRDPASLPPLYFPPDSQNYREFVLGLDIIWIQHDVDGPFFEGDLQVGFDSALPGTWYLSPGFFNEDADLGPIVSNKWITVYADDTLVILFKTNKKLTTGKP